MRFGWMPRWKTPLRQACCRILMDHPAAVAGAVGSVGNGSAFSTVSTARTAAENSGRDASDDDGVLKDISDQDRAQADAAERTHAGICRA
jgi:hypothetical protein